MSLQGDVLFKSWKELFAGKGGFLSQQHKIYSFNGRDILNDFAWLVYLLVLSFLNKSVAFVILFICLF